AAPRAGPGAIFLTGGRFVAYLDPEIACNRHAVKRNVDKAPTVADVDDGHDGQPADRLTPDLAQHAGEVAAEDLRDPRVGMAARREQRGQHLVAVRDVEVR